MEEYVSNNPLKGDNNNKEKKQPVTPIATVKRKKKSEISKFSQTFISDDAKNVKSYVVDDVLVPSVKKAIADIVSNGINMILYGETRRTSGDNRVGIRPSYRSYYDDYRRESRPSTYVRPYVYDDLTFQDERSAVDVLDAMRDILHMQGTVSVAEMYDQCKDEKGNPILSNYTDNKYGWTDLRSAYAEQKSNGDWILRLPKALPLTN